MKISANRLWIALIALAALSGCNPDGSPEPPKTVEGQEIRYVEVATSNPEEMAAVRDMQQARQAYHHRLRVLEDYYQQVGNADKLRWARREIANLKQAMTFEFKGLPDLAPPESVRVDSADERLLVEQAIAARNRYKQAVQDLHEHYVRTEQPLKADLIANTQRRLSPVRQYMYFLDAEIPGPDHRPIRVVAEADQLYDRALSLHERTDNIPFYTDYAEQRKALELFQELIRKYPDSTKIALAAYWIAEIYKEYFDENIRAVHWYQRAWQWDPLITQPARFQAAVIYDIRLREYEKALELYREALLHDPARFMHRQHARSRIQEIEEILAGQNPTAGTPAEQMNRE